jgi:hypothetical protein
MAQKTLYFRVHGRSAALQKTDCLSWYIARVKGGPMPHRISPHEARTIATVAICDPRSVVKAIEGRPLASLTLARIRRALAAMGRSDLMP